MARPFEIQAVNGAQIVPLPGGEVGTHDIYLAFTAAPSAGTVTVEQRQIGSTLWTVIAYAVDITSGELAMNSDGPMASLRVTFADLVGGTIPRIWLTSQPTAWPPSSLMTDGGFGDNSRLRVDQGQTGFFDRKMWRLSHEFTGLDATPLVLKVVIPVNFIIHHQGLTIDEGGIAFRAYRSSQGTEGGTFSDVVPMYSVNFMDEMDPYVFQGTVHTGGTFTPSAPPVGVSVETIRVRTSGATAQQTTVGASAFGERGLLFDTYYLVLSKLTGVTGASSGVYTLIVEERP
jgi:hypothetical protein